MRGFHLRWAMVCFVVVALVAACNQARNESIRLMNRGLEAYQRGDIGTAVQLLEDASKADETHDRVFYYLGLIQFQKMELLDRAEFNLKRAIDLNSDDHDYHYQLGSLYARQRKWVPAINAFESALAVKVDHSESHFRLARALEAEARFDRAQTEYIEAIKLNPRFPEAYNHLGNLYFRFEKYAHAIQVFKNAIENNPDEPTNHNDLGLVYSQQKRYDEAIRQFAAALKLKRGYVGAMFNLGMAYAHNDNPEKAVEYLEQYLSRQTLSEDPARVDAAQEMIVKLERSDDGP